MKKIEDYYLWRELGRGGFGTVWQGYYKKQKPPVAIKVLNVLGVNAFKRFEREIKTLRGINNIHVVKILGHNLHHSPPYYVMEYCNGGSLENRIGQVMPIEAVVIMMHVLNGLRAIHKTGGFHRDIKPHNILQAAHASGQTIFKISDFGLTRIPDVNSAMTNSPMGTTHYMSPQIRAGMPFTQADDIYSFGLTMFQLLNGSAERRVLFTKAPQPLADLLFEMTSENREMRPSVAQIRPRLIQITNDLNTPGFNLNNLTRSDNLGILGIFGAAIAIFINRD